MWQLKKKISIAFKIRLSEFFIKTKSGALDDSIYDDILKEYSISQLRI